MLNTIEFQGKTVEKALENASIALEIPENEIDYEIITYGSTGIFGLIGIRKAIIKVTVKDFSTEKNQRSSTTKKEETISLTKKNLEKKSFISNDQIEIGRAVLQRIIDSITDDANIEIAKHSKQIIFEIKGGVSGVLIGKKGQTLEAIQYIVEKIVNKNNNKRIRLLIDVEGYLKKKRENLQRLANKLVAKVKQTNKPVTIGQMNAHDRRIVHTHLKDDYDVRTQSVGSGYYRKLMIFPQKKY